MPVFLGERIGQYQQEGDLVVDALYDHTEPIRLLDLIRGTGISGICQRRSNPHQCIFKKTIS